MFDFDSLREILSTISKNKMRTALTGFAVAWGIFMLIILLASGNGLKNGVTSNFSNRAQNSVTLWPGWTSMPYKGLPSDRNIKFDDRDYDLIRNKIPEVEYVSARVSQNVTMSYGNEYGAWRLDGVSQDAAHINNIKVRSGDGRFLNKMDVDNKRKVVVISPEMKRVLFKTEDPLGKYVIANGIAYQVIGVFDDTDMFNNNPPAYIPFTTAQMLYNKGWGFRQIDFTVKGLTKLEDNKAFIERVRKRVAQLHMFDPNDRSALYVRNTAEDVAETNQIFNGINIFIWIIGLASLMAGIVGVGNIMLITVKERTREIGVRKAIGATPASVLRLVIFESILITTIAGYIGMIVGIFLTEGISTAMSGGPSRASMDSPTIFKDPTVDLSTVALATFVLVIAGVIAGLIPALKATRVRPIEAMRAE
ncbi:putative ABC transport system permease protein [Dysgonomonas hofstadii]|uniref:Putative ABC transport system permease protein n=1 Tax=Dysgonomonas hofstadii TaxID=637886 RepID=A0A840CTK7_9BACT|nr:ABC transporter permease [Dysgonomonas hofstadii]MBB4038019.1 putative ABC transport system permease protein [Dysgonomonas hofstadii]